MTKKLFCSALCAVLLALSVPTESQQPKNVPRIGYLSALSQPADSYRREAFRQGLRELGYIEGQNIAIEYRYADGKLDRLADLAAELVRHKVEDYEKWKTVFDGDAPTRKAAGSRGARVLRNSGESNEIIVILEWEDHAQARRFAESPELHATMARAGVSDRPDVYYVDEVDRQPA